ncbi:amino acid adenylation domain-containing protein [Peterkaempfera sp. SMS 1(5)a]|uniref:non-ribosomal peptide synthetase n=1 Tax=Peterkaempfera podocarpi TaxID=3232308 RepID=UPI003671C944
MTQQTALPPSAAQRRIWLMQCLAPDSSAYHIPFALELTGPLDVNALVGAFRTLEARHEVLRTGFEEFDGELMQVISPPGRLAVELRETAEADLGARLAADAEAPFDLSLDPLLRVKLHRTGVDQHILSLTMHHLVADMWSVGVLLAELAELYRAGCHGDSPLLPELTLQYGDFAVWEAQGAKDREELHGPFWRAALQDAPALLGLPTDRPRPVVQSLRGAAVPVRLAPDLAEGVQALATAQRVTPFMVLLAAFQAVLARYCGHDDIVVGTGTGVRPPEVESLIGCFINVVPIRTSLAADPSFTELLRRVREASLAAMDHQELPFECMIAGRPGPVDLSHNPVVQALFVLQNAAVELPRLPGLEVGLVEVARGGAQMDLNLQLRAENGGFTGTLEFAADLFDQETATRMAGHWLTLLSHAVASPGARLSTLPVITPAERRRILGEWNATTAQYPEGSLLLHQLFEQRCAEAPDAPAVVEREGTTDYRELDRRAQRISARLRAAGVGPDTVVGLCLPPGSGLVAAVLGVLKAGGAYLPLDPAYPEQRLAFMLADARPAVVVTCRDLAPGLPSHDSPVLLLDDERDWVTEPGAEALADVRTRPGHLAYVIYTSGSTGRPKGIAVPHRGVVNNLLDLNDSHGIGRGDRVLLLSSPSFDMFVYETLGILAAGGAMVVPQPERAKDPQHWLDLARRHRITVWNSAPALADAFVQAGCDRNTRLPALKVAFLGGDWIPVSLPERFRRVAPALSFIALGGATEASIHSIVEPVDAVDPGWTSIPYGRPMVNQQALILDAAGGLAPAGVPGELCLAGVGLTRGYLRRPGLTADRYRPHPGAGTDGVPAGARLYRTGDLAIWRRDGCIQLQGRIDHQVKVRGLRIELGEIEAELCRHPGVAKAVVAAVGAGEQRRLVGYVVPVGPAPSAAELRARLREVLPDFMTPAVYVALDRLPLSPNGKVDRAALPAPEQGAVLQDRPVHVPPDGPVELALAALWQELLAVTTIGRHDDFFALGGHSLLVTRLASALAETFGVEVQLRSLFERAGLAGQAELLIEEGRRSGVDVVAVAEVVAEVLLMSDTDAAALMVGGSVV